MSNLLDLKSLYAIVAKEIENNSIQHIQPTIYRDIAGILSNLKDQGYDGIEAKVMDILAQLIGEIARLLLYTRFDKIKNMKTDYSNLTDEEQYFTASENDFSIRFEQVLFATLEGRMKTLDSMTLKATSLWILLRFLGPIETFSGKDNHIYGPFEEEDVAILPFENAKQLVKSGVAVELPWLN